MIVGTFVFVLPQFANYDQVWAQVKTLSWEWIGVLLGAVALNMRDLSRARIAAAVAGQAAEPPPEAPTVPA